jgi:hypothetical protein
VRENCVGEEVPATPVVGRNEWIVKINKGNLVQDCVAIPLSNYSKSIRDGWCDIPFTHEPARNAKPFKPLVKE